MRARRLSITTIGILSAATPAQSSSLPSSRSGQRAGSTHWITEHRSDEGTHTDSGLRPDLKVTLKQVDYFVDVTVIHPTCISHVRSAQSSLGAAQRAEKKKNDKYPEKSTEVGAKFVPFV